MKRTFLVLCAAFAIASVGVVGAEQYGSSKKPHSGPKSSNEVTLTGCLEQGANPNSFVLRNATETEGGSMGSSSSSQQMSGSSTQGTSGSEGTTGTSAQGTNGSQGEQSPMDFQLTGKNKELKKYVGQRVEIRGKVEPVRENQSGMSNQGTSGTSGTTGSEIGSQGGGSMGGQTTTAGTVTHHVKVNSVKQLSSSCQ